MNVQVARVMYVDRSELEPAIMSSIRCIRPAPPIVMKFPGRLIGRGLRYSSHGSHHFTQHFTLDAYSIAEQYLANFTSSRRKTTHNTTLGDVPRGFSASSPHLALLPYIKNFPLYLPTYVIGPAKNS